MKKSRGGLTCQAGQKKLIGALIGIFVIIGQHSEAKHPLVERMTSNDAQVLQRNPGRCVEGDQHVAAHFFNRLWKKNMRKQCCKMKQQSQGFSKQKKQGKIG